MDFGYRLFPRQTQSEMPAIAVVPLYSSTRHSGSPPSEW
jgi:hypothetical protein